MYDWDVVRGSLTIFNFATRAFDLTFAPENGEGSAQQYNVPGMDRLVAMLRTIGISLSDEELRTLRSGRHLTKEVELTERNRQTFFG